MKKKFVIRKIMIGRESLYLYKGEYGNTFGYGINQVYEIKQFDTKEEAESIISQLGDGMYEIEK